MESVMLVLFFIVTNAVIYCDDSSQNYFVVEVPPDLRAKKPFNVYWNVPTSQCRSKKIPFDNLEEKFGIIQNKDDSFRGEKVAILYDPGCFPAILTKDGTKEVYFRNGGVPQEGDLAKHLRTFRSDVEKLIPDANFSGIGVIDFESWRPVFRQNFGVINPYKNLSIEIEKQRHPWWYSSKVKAEARRRFEASAREFMLQSIQAARRLRPLARWGYYGFPYCFNAPPGGQFTRCSKEAGEENDRTAWLWDASDALYPSIYSSQAYDSDQLTAMVRTRVAEAARARPQHLLPYYWYRHRDGDFLSEKDVKAVFSTLYRSNATGVVIWGSSQDVRTVAQCQRLYEYINNTLGPIVAKYTTTRAKIHGENGTEFEETTENSTTGVTEDFELPITPVTEPFNFTKVEVDNDNYNSSDYIDNAANDSLSLFDIMFENITNEEYYNVSHVNANNLLIVKNDEDVDEDEFVIIDEHVENFLKAIKFKLQRPFTLHEEHDNKTQIINLMRNVHFNNSINISANGDNDMKLNKNQSQNLFYKIHTKVSNAINNISRNLTSLNLIKKNLPGNIMKIKDATQSTLRTTMSPYQNHYNKYGTETFGEKYTEPNLTINDGNESNNSNYTNDDEDDDEKINRSKNRTKPTQITEFSTQNVQNIPYTDYVTTEYSRIHLSTEGPRTQPKQIKNRMDNVTMLPYIWSKLLPNTEYGTKSKQNTHDMSTTEEPNTELELNDSYFDVTDNVTLLPKHYIVNATDNEIVSPYNMFMVLANIFHNLTNGTQDIETIPFITDMLSEEENNFNEKNIFLRSTSNKSKGDKESTDYIDFEDDFTMPLSISKQDDTSLDNSEDNYSLSETTTIAYEYTNTITDTINYEDANTPEEIKHSTDSELDFPVTGTTITINDKDTENVARTETIPSTKVFTKKLKKYKQLPPSRDATPPSTLPLVNDDTITSRQKKLNKLKLIVQKVRNVVNFIQKQIKSR